MRIDEVRCEVLAAVLARAGAEVILVCRSEGRGAEACDAIRAETGSERVSLMLCDVSSQIAVRDFCRAFRHRYDRLDVLINNAGGYVAQRSHSADGLEMTFAVNHMGYFLMARGLLASLQVAHGARVVNVASMGHRLGRLDFDDIQWSRRRFMAFRAYCDSKLMNIQFTKALARRLRGQGITVNCLHPGAVRSGFAVSEAGWFGGLVRFGSGVLKSPETGAKTPVYLASDPDVAGITGEYFYNRRLRTPSRAARDEAQSERLWTLSESLVQHDPAA